VGVVALAKQVTWLSGAVIVAWYVLKNLPPKAATYPVNVTNGSDNHRNCESSSVETVFINWYAEGIEKLKYHPLPPVPKEASRPHLRPKVVRLAVEFPAFEGPPAGSAGVGACCGTPLSPAVRDYVFGIGDGPRLEVIVPNTPLYVCGCGRSVALPTASAIAIEQKGRLITNALDLGDAEGLAPLRLEPDDAAKIVEFGEHVRSEGDQLREARRRRRAAMPRLSPGEQQSA
jgi:hypothetical protein